MREILDSILAGEREAAGVLCLAPREGLGVRNESLRDRHLAEINRFRKRAEKDT